MQDKFVFYSAAPKTCEEQWVSVFNKSDLTLLSFALIVTLQLLKNKEMATQYVRVRWPHTAVTGISVQGLAGFRVEGRARFPAEQSFFATGCRAHPFPIQWVGGIKMLELQFYSQTSLRMPHWRPLTSVFHVRPIPCTSVHQNPRRLAQTITCDPYPGTLGSYLSLFGHLHRAWHAPSLHANARPVPWNRTCLPPYNIIIISLLSKINNA